MEQKSQMKSLLCSTGSGTNGSGAASECGTVIERSCLAIGDFTLKNHEISEEGFCKMNCNTKRPMNGIKV